MTHRDFLVKNLMANGDFLIKNLAAHYTRQIFRIEDIVVGSGYEVNVTLKNTGAQTFNGGVLDVKAQWANNQFTFSSYVIKSLAHDESVTVLFQHGALDKHFGLLFAELVDSNAPLKDGKPPAVQLYNENNVPYMGQCFGSVWAVDMEDLLTRYALGISAGIIVNTCGKRSHCSNNNLAELKTIQCLEFFSQKNPITTCPLPLYFHLDGFSSKQKRRFNQLIN